MSTKLKEKKLDQIDQDIAMQMITFSVVIIIVILTLVSFIRICSNKKEQILKDMKTESQLLETVITDHLNYSRYFINIIGRNILSDHKNLLHIHKTLSDGFTSQDFNMMFGWRKYSWVNKNSYEVVSSTKGIIDKPQYAEYMRNLDRRNQIEFYTKICSNKGNSLKIIDNLFNPITEKYLGSVVLSYDINTMVRSLNMRKKNNSTHFIILDRDMRVIAQSREIIGSNVDNSNGLDFHLNKLINTLQSHEDGLQEISYLDMLNGLNYSVSLLKDLPFTMIVNIDNEVIRQDIIDSITKKFIEVCVFAIVFLFMVISIYKRETILRAKAEKATAVANSLTKAKSDFLAFTAHEIRSPLSFILTGSEIMKKELWGKLSPKYKKYAEGIHKNSKLILDFINDILDESQIVEGKFKIINTLTDIPKVIDESIKLANNKHHNKSRIKIKKEIEEPLPLLICDKRRIQQVFVNLISNAIKYSKDDTTITIMAKVVNDRMEIKVMDQGIGMKEEDIPIALSAYGTLQGIDYQSTGSYGLGLAIVKMLLDSHDATLSLSSVEKKGTTVKIIFPKYKLVYNAHNRKNPHKEL
ncbi:MAG: HAMP domain-containing histidine kinase [Rickettsiaceae bacterium]|nr:HAMP domain-containing histidine kinase [Rickettsiaceae bacterium]